ncbi:MAG: hypothetical protein V3T70_05680 [Phycisphaerae bacterium]
MDLDRLAVELDAILAAAVDGEMFAGPPFDALPEDSQLVRDVAFSGDGEPTLYPHLREAIGIVAEACRRPRSHSRRR